jgi:hypothetical protein
VPVSSRLVGVIGVSNNPTSAMAIVTLIGTGRLLPPAARRGRRDGEGDGADGRHGRLRRGLEGGRHLAGPERPASS